MVKILTAEIEEIDNGVLLRIDMPARPSGEDPLGQRTPGLSFGPRYYADLGEALNAIPETIAVREARTADHALAA